MVPKHAAPSHTCPLEVDNCACVERRGDGEPHEWIGSRWCGFVEYFSEIDPLLPTPPQENLLRQFPQVSIFLLI